ncbi:MAG: RusA family crossover junction endodeoxyribonuclease [Christensenellales bacterium]|jgi:Holliday junction resolvase RusA-like endonuclease
MTITFTVLGEPVGKARQRVTRFGTYTPEKTVLYENLIKTEYRRQCNDHRFDDKQPLCMEVKAEYMIPASASKAKRAAMARGEIRPMKKPDWDNVGKVVSDALNKLAYRDDTQIVDCTVRKFYSERPKITVKIGPAEL